MEQMNSRKIQAAAVAALAMALFMGAFLLLLATLGGVCKWGG